MHLPGNEPKEEYIRRINQALAFVDTHLDQELSLESVSEAAHYSPFHFHRIFKAVMHETIHAYIHRKRIEKTASVLLRKPEVRISELSFRYGFTSNSSFTRAFKNFYGVSPSKFRAISPGKFSKIRQVNSKIGQERFVFEKYICTIDHPLNWIKMNATIEIKAMPALHLAYVTHVGDCQLLGTAYEKLMRWAGPKGLLTSPDVKMVTVYHDSLKLTDPAKVRLSASILLPEPMKTEGEIGSMILDSGKCIVVSFDISLTDFEKAWTSVFVWLKENGYKPMDRNCFEIYHTNPNEHPEKKCRVDLCIPIE